MFRRLPHSADSFGIDFLNSLAWSSVSRAHEEVDGQELAPDGIPHVPRFRADDRPSPTAKPSTEKGLSVWLGAIHLLRDQVDLFGGLCTQERVLSKIPLHRQHTVTINAIANQPLISIPLGKGRIDKAGRRS